MRGISWLVSVALVVACRAEPPPAPARSPGSSTDPWAAGSGARAAGSAASPGTAVAATSGSAAASDPWAVAEDPDAPPSLAERKKLVDDACPAVTAPYFFRVEKAGKTSYILGTRHISVPLAKFPPTVHDTIASAKLVVFEVAPDDDHHSERKELDLMSELGDKTWQHYEALVGREMASTVERGSPATALVGMMVLYEDPSAQLESDIEQVARGAGIPMRGLETAAFQDGVLDHLLDVRMLRATIDNTTDRAELMKDMHDDIAGYCSGTDDEPGMDSDDRKKMHAAGYSDTELDAFDNEMLFSRNTDWIPKLERLFATSGVFVAVGAGHLEGPRSVIALLAKRGFKITRIK